MKLDRVVRHSGARIDHTPVLIVLFWLAWLVLGAFGAAGQQNQTNDPPQSQQPAANPDSPEGKRSGVGFRLGGAGMNGDPGSLDIDTGGMPGKSPESDEQQGKPYKRVEFVGAPVPVISPTIGNGLAGVGGIAIHLDPNDRKSPASVFGGGMLFTSNGTRAFGAVTQLFLKEDRFRVLGVYVDGRINYDYFGIGHDSGEAGHFIPLTLNAFGLLFEPKMRIGGRWYIGPRYRLLRSDVALDRERFEEEFPGVPANPDQPTIPPRDVSVRSGALGMRLQRDTRDSQFYPLRGSLFDTKIDFADPAFASQRSYENLNFSYQAYHSLGPKTVLAYRGAVCSASGDVPFYNLCMFGQSKDIRGYAVGRYQDRRMIVGQAELRRELFWKVGAVGYFGAGEVAPEFSKLSMSNILPGGGVGLRLTLAPQNHINFRVDYAWGKDSTGLYVGIAESF